MDLIELELKILEKACTKMNQMRNNIAWRQAFETSVLSLLLLAQLSTTSMKGQDRQS